MRLVIGFLLICVSHIAHGTNVASKLDFTESKDVNLNSKVPKMYGVHVLVDTPTRRGLSKVETVNNREIFDDDDETVENVRSKSKKTVGIRTDITLDLSNENNESNSTTSKDAEENDNASVPVFKGKPDVPDLTVHGLRRWDNHNNKPAVHNNQPVFHRTDDEHVQYHGWSNFIPATGTWTTERSFYPRNRGNTFKSNVPYTIGNQKLKPCYCEDAVRRNNPSVQRRQVYLTPLTPMKRPPLFSGVDDKLEIPFNREN